MSKMDGLRAMREARYEAARAAKPGAKPVAVAAPKVTPTPRATDRPAPGADLPEAEEALCGHRNMSGRTCTREAGHAAKSHRYS